MEVFANAQQATADWSGPLVDNVAEAISDVANTFGFNLGLAPGASKLLAFAQKGFPSTAKSFWMDDIVGERWYKVYPYQFVVVQLNPDGSEKTKVTDSAYYTLPIPPQAMTVKPIIASQATATVGGVVEETSGNVFWLISLVGTTGTAIGRSTADKESQKMATHFRSKMETTGLAGTFASLGKFANKTLGTVDSITAGLQGGSPASVMNGISGAIQNLLLPTSPFPGSAVSKLRNGYQESLALQRFLYVYSKLKGAFPGSYALKFRNYKTAQEWRCVVQDFAIQQNSTNPHLYRYTIQLKCWEIRSINSSLMKTAEYDRFNGGDLQSVNMLTPAQAVSGMKALGGNLSSAFWGT